MKTFLFVGAGFFALSIGSAVQADPIRVQPDGSVVLDSTLSTRGVFTCRHSQCSGTGTNSVTFTNGAERATITFVGVDTMVQVTNRATQTSLGYFEATATPGFTFPQRNNQYWPVVHFAMFATQGDPVDDTFRKGWDFGRGGSTELSILSGTSELVFRFPEGLAGVRRYTGIVYTVRPFPIELPSSGRLDVVADVGLVPEPASLVLLGSGLAGIVAARRRRRGGASRQAEIVGQ